MTKVVIVGDMTFGEVGLPPGTPGQLPSPQPPGAVTPPIVLPPGQPGAPDQGLPPIPGIPLPPIALPPDTIWPPLPPGTPEPHKLVAIVAVPGVGYRYVVVDIKGGGHPDQGLPSEPVYPDQGLPPHREPKHGK
jgi:hypothetical protein